MAGLAEHFEPYERPIGEYCDGDFYFTREHGEEWRRYVWAPDGPATPFESPFLPGVATLGQLARMTTAVALAIYGVGPRTVARWRGLLHEARLTFADEPERVVDGEG